MWRLINPHAQRQNEEYIPLIKISSSQGKPVAIGKPAIGTVAVTDPCKHTVYGSSLLPPTPYESSVFYSKRIFP